MSTNFDMRKEMPRNRLVKFNIWSFDSRKSAKNIIKIIQHTDILRTTQTLHFSSRYVSVLSTVSWRNITKIILRYISKSVKHRRLTIQKGPNDNSSVSQKLPVLYNEESHGIKMPP